MPEAVPPEAAACMRRAQGKEAEGEGRKAGRRTKERREGTGRGEGRKGKMWRRNWKAD